MLLASSSDSLRFTELSFVWLESDNSTGSENLWALEGIMGEFLEGMGSVDKELKNLIAGFSASITGLE
ncbi:hypothetical protein DIZ73_18545 [Legionella pneumophila]|nr:hypothetical protein DIZ73_18545 [Legionella pneumophila]